VEGGGSAEGGGGPLDIAVSWDTHLVVTRGGCDDDTFKVWDLHSPTHPVKLFQCVMVLRP